MKKFFEFMKTLSLAFVFSRLEKWAENMPMVEYKVFTQKRIDDLKKLYNLLIDKEPDNMAQLKALYIEEREFFTDDALILSAKIVREHVKDELEAELIASKLIELANMELFAHRDGLVSNSNSLPQPIKTSLKGKRQTLAIAASGDAGTSGTVTMEQPPSEAVETPEQARLRMGDEQQAATLAETQRKEREDLERKLSGGETVAPTGSLAADFLAAQQAEKGNEPEIPFPDVAENSVVSDNEKEPGQASEPEQKKRKA